MVKTSMKVEGMSCEHCVRAITQALAVLPGVGGVWVDLKAHTVCVEHDPQLTAIDKIRAEIEEQGYEVLA